MLLDFPKPKGWAEKHGSHYIVIRNKWHRLCRVSEGAVPFWRAYYKLTKADPEFMAGVFIAFLEDGLPQMVADGDLTAGTAKKYEEYIVGRLIPYCGHMYRNDINSAHVATFLENRKEAGAPKGGNRERAAWSTANEWAMRRGWLTSNPCRGVRRNKERPAKVYVEHQQLTSGIDKAPMAMQNIQAVGYLWGARQVDLRLLTREAVRRAIESQPDKDKKRWVHIDESKTGKIRSHELTDTVLWFLARAEEHRANLIERYEAAAKKLETLSQHRRAAAHRAKIERIKACPQVFLTVRGLPWTESGMQSAMARLDVDYTFRQLRPKAASDADHNILGHGPAMLARYQKREKLKAIK
jgi:hypothetical protein